MRRLLLAVWLWAAAVAPAHAQRTDDNAARQAEDAFGSSVGNERVGLYNPFDVRGFSPVDAGNVRLDGLYFDQQARITDRIAEGSTVRVGLTAQSYPFPAPTGIADFRIRRAGDELIVSPALTVGPFGGWSAELDAKLPLVDGKLGVALGVGVYREQEHFGGTPKYASVAILPRWRPADDVEIIPFWSRIRFSDEEAQPLLITDGTRLPPKIARRTYLGQDWADNDGHADNYGVLANARLGGWTLRGGLFRSLVVEETSFANIFTGVTPAATATSLVVANPELRYGSVSGELRVSRSLVEGERLHTLHLSLRGREQRRRYGGSQLLNYGTVSLAAQVARPQPVFAFGAQTRDHVRQDTLGLAYEGRWKHVGELSLGLQKSDYRKTVTAPARVVPETRDKPWLFNATAAVYATHDVALYAGFTRGLEESPVAPVEAVNRAEAPPAIRTRQIDGGVRWALTPKLKLVAGLFEVRKPYFNLDSANRFGQLGLLHHRGVELSLAGELLPNLNVVAGTVLLDAKVSGTLVDTGVIRDKPVGSIGRTSVLVLDYRLPQVQGLSVDAVVESTSDRAASATTALVVPARAVLSLGARYRFKVEDTPMTARAVVGNVFNNYGFSTGGSGFFIYNVPRRFTFSITADF
jgi:iron complex outermembrane receptor protein